MNTLKNITVFHEMLSKEIEFQVQDTASNQGWTDVELVPDEMVDEWRELAIHHMLEKMTEDWV